MKIRIEITDADEEIVIKCREKTEKVALMESFLDNLLKGRDELRLTIGDTEYYLAKQDILFFEANGGKVYAHTADHMYLAAYKLYELEHVMPSYFVRISKSVIANIKQIRSLRRELTGNGAITFNGCDKTAYFSRGYYHVLKDKIEEVRFGS